MAAIKTIATLTGFDYANPTELEEIRMNLNCLYSTPEGTCPGDRAFGLKQDFVGMPVDVARNKVALEIIEKTALYEPRVEIIGIEYGPSEDGAILVNVLLGPGEGQEGAEEEIGG